MEKNLKEVLYYWYRKIRESGVVSLFDNFEDFANWSLANGYEYGLRLRRKDTMLEYSPDNCIWVDLQYHKTTKEKENKAAIERWDKFITPIRERYKNQLEMVQEQKEAERVEEARTAPPVREYFRYEHPDLEREGIVFESFNCL